jgi:hypothetical protein
VREDRLREVGDVGLNDEADVSGVESPGKLSTAQGFRKVLYSPGNYASPDSPRLLVATKQHGTRHRSYYFY